MSGKMRILTGLVVIAIVVVVSGVWIIRGPGPLDFAGGTKVALADYRAGKIGFGGSKKLLVAKINEYFGPFRERRKKLAEDPEFVEDVLHRGVVLPTDDRGGEHRGGRRARRRAVGGGDHPIQQRDFVSGDTA